MFPDWFSPYARDCFSRHLSGLAGRDGLRFLQVGAFTGDATVWLCENVLTANDSVLVDVDTWLGSDEPEHDTMDFEQVEQVYDDRTAKHRSAGRLIKAKTTSLDYFQQHTTSRFDFIYIDGDHTAPGVLSDAVHAIPLLRPGGLLAFDDYQWRSVYGPFHSPAPAINAIRRIYREHLTTVEIDAQAWFRAA